MKKSILSIAVMLVMVFAFVTTSQALMTTAYASASKASSTSVKMVANVRTTSTSAKTTMRIILQRYASGSWSNYREYSGSGTGVDVTISKTSTGLPTGYSYRTYLISSSDGVPNSYTSSSVSL